jgi:hypothetical protein
LDGRGAELSGVEPVGRLRMICQSWKAMFQAEYSFGQPLRMLVDLRAAVDAALADSGEVAGQATAIEATANEVTADDATADALDAPLRAMAAAASGESSAETEASGAPPNESGSRSGGDFDL